MAHRHAGYPGLGGHPQRLFKTAVRNLCLFGRAESKRTFQVQELDVRLTGEEEIPNAGGEARPNPG